MTKQYGGPDGTSEGREIRRDVVDGGDESLIRDVGDSYEDTAHEGHGQEDAHHKRSLAEIPQNQPPPTGHERNLPGLLGQPEAPDQPGRSGSLTAAITARRGSEPGCAPSGTYALICLALASKSWT